MCRTSPCSCFSNAGLRVTIARYDGRAAMRWYVSIGAVLVAGALAGGDVAGIAAPSLKNEMPRQNRQPLADKETQASVQVELVPSVEVSYSMDIDELANPRQGHALA